MKKLILICFLIVMFSGANAQWGPYPYGTDYITNTNTGGVVVRLDATTPASIPSWGNWGLFSYATASHTSGTASKVWGAYLLSLNNKTGILTESIGSYVTAGNESSGTGTVSNAYGLYSKVQSGAGTVSNGYGVYVANIAATNDYGVYQASSDDDNFFAGRVAIGSASFGSFKLAVDGKVGAREVVVTLANPWPDYVFAPNYKLPSLSEVESFIKTNKHLPEIPSEENIKADGHNLGSMNALLLKKVEELTLYAIQQEKRLNEQSSLIEEQQKLLMQLKDKLDASGR